MRLINGVGRALIERFEGLALTSYQDIAGVWTIGYGHIGPDVLPGMTITQQQADQLLTMDLIYTCSQVDAYAPGASDNQFAAMVSLAFDIGTGTRGFAGSSVLRGYLARDRIAAGKAFLLWDHAHIDGVLVEVEGLFARRVAEADLYLGGNG